VRCEVGQGNTPTRARNSVNRSAELSVARPMEPSKAPFGMRKPGLAARCSAACRAWCGVCNRRQRSGSQAERGSTAGAGGETGTQEDRKAHPVVNLKQLHCSVVRRTKGKSGMQNEWMMNGSMSVSLPTVDGEQRPHSRPYRPGSGREDHSNMERGQGPTVKVQTE